ncbi:MAG: YicC family protein [Nitrospiraceae bacterium]|nr:YicC family protein [Nitrospiraceae bacterium]
MTGFGASEKDGFRIEIRSLNHRFTDISMRLMPWLSEHEIPLRNLLKERFSRGKFDATVTLKDYSKLKLKVNTALAKEIYDNLNFMKTDLAISEEIGINAMLAYKEFLISEEPEYNISSLYDAFNQAMDQLEKMRRNEGRTIQEDIVKRIDHLESLNKQLMELSPEAENKFKIKINERIKEFLDEIQTDKDRITHEIVVLAEKIDITEEIIRIDNHLKQFRKILSNGDTIGKRLDFLLQELNRESNTVGSKTDDYKISSFVIEMKSEIEKIREQAQNIQ